MDDMARRFKEEQERIARRDSSQAAWVDSGATSQNAIAGTPTGDFRDFVTSALKIIPRSYWRPAYVGLAPDGTQRIRWTDSHLVRHKNGGVGNARTRGVKACRAVADVHRGDMIVLLKDGRGCYTGDLAVWSAQFPLTVASGEKLNDPLIGPLCARPWKFA